MELELTEKGIKISDGQTLSWKGLTGLKKPLWSNQLEIQGLEGKVALPSGIDKSWILRFYEIWRTHDAEAALKNAFDYIDLRRGFAGILLVISVVFAGGFGFIATNDAWEQLHCSSALQEEHVSAQASVVKLKRKRATHYIVNLSFLTGDGRQIKGNEQLLQREDKAPGETLPIVYSPKHPECWSVVTEETKEAGIWAKRRFFGAYLMMMGIIFLGAGIFGGLTALRLLKERRPYTKEISALFGLEL